MARKNFAALLLFVLFVLVPITATADEVILKNGDHLTGTVTAVEGGKLKMSTALAGDVTIDLKNIQTFRTDKPLKIKLQDNSVVTGKVSSGAIIVPPPPMTRPAQVVVGNASIRPPDIKQTIQPAAWKGSVIVNGNLARGNTHAENLGVAADATLRRNDEFHNDRFMLNAAYNFGRQEVHGVSTTSSDNWFAQGKYDDFFTEKLYGYAVFRYDHDRLADLNYRLSPGVGLGYQWIESPDFNFSTEGGASYVWEDYSTGNTQQRVALRLAYHLDKKLNDQVSLFHNAEWLPAFSDPADYILNADVGVRAKLIANMFSEFKVQLQRDSRPAPGAEKNDLRFILGVGWTF